MIGTVGHVDYGKTTFVKALIGIDTDRLKEEKERVMSIEPGFAYLKLPSVKVVSIVDVPGHEKFIRNMFRGISEVDSVLLVGTTKRIEQHLIFILGGDHGSMG